LKTFLVALTLFFSTAAPPTHTPPFQPAQSPPSSAPTFPVLPAQPPKAIQTNGAALQGRPCAPGPVCIQAYRFSSHVDAKSAKALAEFLDQARKNHIDVVMVELTTPGGEYTYGHEIARYIENSPVPVVCVADGVLASMGVYIYASCDRRLITPRASLLLHSAMNPTPGAYMNEHELAEALNGIHHLNIAYASHVISKMKGVTLEQYFAKIDGKEWLLSADEAVANGIAQAVYRGTPNDLLQAIRSGQTP